MERPTAARLGALFARALLAVAAGALVYRSFAPHNQWWCAPIGFAVLLMVLRSGGGLLPLRARAGFGYGYLAGLGYFGPLLPWVGTYVGAVPWLALAAIEVLFVGAFGAGAVVLWRLPWAPLWLACWWSATEFVRAHVPFGGFPWGRVGFGQSEGVLLRTAALGGPAAVSFLVVLLGAGAATGLLWLSTQWLRSDGGGLSGLGGAVPILVVLAAVIVAPWLPGPRQVGTLQVSAVQGNVPRAGLDFNAQRRQVLDNHVLETTELVRQVATGAVPAPDLVVWPENASDIDPYRNADARAEITASAVAVGAPILVGAVLANDDGSSTNSVIVWDGDGPSARHDKRFIQPFGEYLPLRGLVSHFSSYADRAGNFVAGDASRPLPVAGTSVGVATCYEVAFDPAFRDAVDAGAQLLTVPTNNATFGKSDMSYQQLAMSQVRAVEHGRAVVVAATSGISAFVGVDGAVEQQSSFFTPAVLSGEVPLFDGRTVADRIGPWGEWTAAAAGTLVLAGVVVGGWWRRRH